MSTCKAVLLFIPESVHFDTTNDEERGDKSPHSKGSSLAPGLAKQEQSAQVAGTAVFNQ